MVLNAYNDTYITISYNINYGGGGGTLTLSPLNKNCSSSNIYISIIFQFG